MVKKLRKAKANLFLTIINVCPVNAMEPVFSLRPVTDLDVMRMIKYFKPSRAKYKYIMDVVML